MRKRISVSAALTGLALTAVLCGCASTTQSGASAGASAPSATTAPASPVTSPAASSAPAPAGGAPAGGAPIIFAVRLDHGFSPNTLRLSPGQHFVLTVASSVKASGTLGACSAATAQVYGGMLSVHCTSGTYYYTAERAGTAVLTATVRPNCTGGGMCPQWIEVATLKIKIL